MEQAVYRVRTAAAGYANRWAAQDHATIIMNAKTQLLGLNEFLTVVYGTETRISTILFDLGFEQRKIELLRDHHLESVVNNFIGVIEAQLNNARLFYIILRRYSFDGEPQATLQEIGQKLNVSRERIRQLEAEAIKRCSFKTTLQTYSVRLHEIALEKLGQISAPPTPNDIIGKLNQLAEIQARLEATQFNLEEKRIEILGSVRTELDVLEAQYIPKLQKYREEISRLEAEIKNDVLLNGTTISGPKYKAIYIRGRTTWDTKGLLNYAKSNPEVSKFRSQGRPSVRIRSISTNTSASTGNINQDETQKTYKVEEIQKEFPKAYERWTVDEDESLKQQYAKGLAISELATHFERKEGAVRSRLKKLGLLE